MTRMNQLFGIGALGLALTLAGPAIAQTQGGSTGQMPSATQSAQSFSPQQVSKFADASGQIRAIRQGATQKMQQAASKSERAQIRKQAQQDMLAAIKDSGLTVQEYNQIARAAQSNPQLAQQIKQMR